jgi:hypothetical protein
MPDPTPTPDANIPPKTAQDFSEEEDWPSYFGAVLGKPPRDTLRRARGRR